MTETTKAPAANGKTVPVATAPAERRRMRDPFTFFDTLQDELTRLWGQTWPLMPRQLVRAPSPIAELTTTWAPRVDVFEKNGDIVVKAELPGVAKEDVKLTIDEDELVIEGERHSEKEVEEKDFYRMERSYGSFYRRIPMPAGVQAEQVKATFADGVLEVHIPKPAQAESQAHKIAIS